MHIFACFAKWNAYVDQLLPLLIHQFLCHFCKDFCLMTRQFSFQKLQSLSQAGVCMIFLPYDKARSRVKVEPCSPFATSGNWFLMTDILSSTIVIIAWTHLESNEDLLDTWKEKQNTISEEFKSTFSLLFTPKRFSSYLHILCIPPGKARRED